MKWTELQEKAGFLQISKLRGERGLTQLSTSPNYGLQTGDEVLYLERQNKMAQEASN